MSGTVSTCQSTKKEISIPTCHMRRFPWRGRKACKRPLLDPGSRIAFEHFVFHRMPDVLVELEETRREADFRHIARTWQVDPEFADRSSLGAGGKHDHAIGHRNGLFQVVRNEQDGL